MPRCSTTSWPALTQVSAFYAFPERTDAPAKTTNVKFAITVGGDIYGARGSSLYLMTGTRDVTMCADIVYRKNFRTHH